MPNLHTKSIASALFTSCLLVSCIVTCPPYSPTPPISQQLGTGHGVIQNFREALPGVYSGGQPVSKAAFQKLEALGVTTIVSVDGASPDVDTARQHGLQYIHIPIGYDDVPTPAALALTRVFRERSGPVFVHCHHGVHRGPAAVAIACIGAGLLANEDAKNILETAGTSRDYAGLWRAVATFQAPPEDAKLPTLVEAAEVPGFVTEMAQADRAFDNLNQLAKNQWKKLPKHPDLSASQEALILWESMRESVRFSPHIDDTRFQTQMAEAEKTAKALFEAIKTSNHQGADAGLKKLKNGCTQCHRSYRN